MPLSLFIPEAVQPGLTRLFSHPAIGQASCRKAKLIGRIFKLGRPARKYGFYHPPVFNRFLNSSCKEDNISLKDSMYAEFFIASASSRPS
jgi:hypothetical protein